MSTGSAMQNKNASPKSSIIGSNKGGKISNAQSSPNFNKPTMFPTKLNS